MFKKVVFNNRSYCRGYPLNAGVGEVLGGRGTNVSGVGAVVGGAYCPIPPLPPGISSDSGPPNPGIVSSPPLGT